MTLAETVADLADFAAKALVFYLVVTMAPALLAIVLGALSIFSAF